MRLSLQPRWILGVVAGLAALVWSGFLARGHLEGRASLLDRAEVVLLDLRLLVAGPRDPGQNVVIVAIDDETVREVGRYPLPRATLARLVRALAQHQPKAIGLDILFLDQGLPDEDASLAEALHESRAVLAAAGLFAQGREIGTSRRGASPLAFVEQVLWPIDSVRRQAAIGLVNISTDHGGTPRHVPLLFRTADAMLPSFVLRVASAAAGAGPTIREEAFTVGTVGTRTDLGLTLPLHFYGARGTIPTISARAVLQDEAPAAQIQGRTVVVGATAIGTGDTFTTPFDPVLPGVEVLATGINHLIRGDGLVRDTAVRRVDAAVAVMLALGAVAILTAAPLSLALVVVAFTAASWLAFTLLAFQSGYWFSAAVPLAAMAPTVAVTTLGRQLLDRREAKRHEVAEAALRLFQPPGLVDRIAADPSYLAEPQEQHAAVLFIDLSRFTRLSERLGPARTRELLRGFHALVEEETNASGGVVLSYMGDGAMMGFGLPEPKADDTGRALTACFTLLRRAQEWIASLSVESEVDDIDVRIGAHFGPVVASRLGAETHQHITITGDTVNVASRLLEVASAERAALVVSADLLATVGDSLPGRSAFRHLKAVEIRGRRKPLWVGLWSPETPAPAGDPAASRFV